MAGTTSSLTSRPSQATAGQLRSEKRTTPVSLPEGFIAAIMPVWSRQRKVDSPLDQSLPHFSTHRTNQPRSPCLPVPTRPRRFPSASANRKTTSSEFESSTID